MLKSMCCLQSPWISQLTPRQCRWTDSTTGKTNHIKFWFWDELELSLWDYLIVLVPKPIWTITIGFHLRFVGTDQDCGQHVVLLQASHSDGQSSNRSHHQHPEKAGRPPPIGFHPCWNYRCLASQRYDLRGRQKRRVRRLSWDVVFLDSLLNSRKACSHFYTPQSISSDPSAQSALLSHTRWDSTQWPLAHMKSVTARQLTGSTTSKTHKQRQADRWKEIRFLILLRTNCQEDSRKSPFFQFGRIKSSYLLTNATVNNLIKTHPCCSLCLRDRTQKQLRTLKMSSSKTLYLMCELWVHCQSFKVWNVNDEWNEQRGNWHSFSNAFKAYGSFV